MEELYDIKWSKDRKFVLSSLDRYGKWLEKIDNNLDNHITSLEHRITQMETNLKSLTKLFFVLLTGVLGIFGMVLVLLVG